MKWAFSALFLMLSGLATAIPGSRNLPNRSAVGNNVQADGHVYSRRPENSMSMSMTSDNQRKLIKRGKTGNAPPSPKKSSSGKGSNSPSQQARNSPGGNQNPHSPNSARTNPGGSTTRAIPPPPTGNVVGGGRQTGTSSTGGSTGGAQINTASRTPKSQASGSTEKGNPVAISSSSNGGSRGTTPSKPNPRTPMTNKDLRGVWNDKKKSFTPLMDQVLPGQKPKLIRPPMKSPFEDPLGVNLGRTSATNHPLANQPGSSSPQPNLSLHTGRRDSKNQPAQQRQRETQPSGFQSPRERDLGRRPEHNDGGTPRSNSVHSQTESRPESIGTKLQQNVGLATAWAKQHKTLTALGCVGVVAGCMGIAGTPLLVYGTTAGKAVGMGLVSTAGTATTVAGAGGALVGITEWQKSAKLTPKQQYEHYQSGVGEFARAASLENLKGKFDKFTSKAFPPRKGDGEGRSLLGRTRRGSSSSLSSAGSGLGSINGMGSRVSSAQSLQSMGSRKSSADDLARMDSITENDLHGFRPSLRGNSPPRAPLIGDPLNTGGSTSTSNSFSAPARLEEIDQSSPKRQSGSTSDRQAKEIQMTNMKKGG